MNPTLALEEDLPGLRKRFVEDLLTCLYVDPGRKQNIMFGETSPSDALAVFRKGNSSNSDSVARVTADIAAHREAANLLDTCCADLRKVFSNSVISDMRDTKDLPAEALHCIDFMAHMAEVCKGKCESLQPTLSALERTERYNECSLRFLSTAARIVDRVNALSKELPARLVPGLRALYKDMKEITVEYNAKKTMLEHVISMNIRDGHPTHIKSTKPDGRISGFSSAGDTDGERTLRAANTAELGVAVFMEVITGAINELKEII